MPGLTHHGIRRYVRRPAPYRRAAMASVLPFISSQNHEDLLVLKQLIVAGEGRTSHRPDLPANRGPASHPVCAGGNPEERPLHRLTRRPPFTSAQARHPEEHTTQFG